MDAVAGTEAAEEVIERLSWLCIINNQVLYGRAPGGDVFFDPGCRRVEGKSDEQALFEKIKLDFEIELSAPIQLMTSFAAPAWGKPDGVMVEMRCFAAQYPLPLKLRPTPHIAEFGWFTSGDQRPTSEAGRAILQFLNAEGLIW